ncbi:MAG: hypothetical protein AAFY71_16085 [Bacteroidota bacterium]
MSYISTKKATRVGFLLVVFPAAFLFFGTVGSVAFLLENTDMEFPIPEPAVFFGGLLIGGILGTLWWMMSFHPWRIWAFSKVNDPIDLQAKAIGWFIMPNPEAKGMEAFFANTFFASSKGKQKWELLLSRLEEKETFLQEEKIVYQSSLKILSGTLLMAIVPAFGLLGMLFIEVGKPEFYFALALLIAGIIFYAVPFKYNEHMTLPQRIKAIQKKEPQLILNQSGLELVQEKYGLIPWKDIEQVREERESQSERIMFLSFRTGGEYHSRTLYLTNMDTFGPYLIQLVKLGKHHFG